MTQIRVKGFKIFKDRHGKPRCYHRATGIAVDLAKNPLGSAEFFAECGRISLSADKSANARAGTLGKLILAFKLHPAFLDLAPRTKINYENYFHKLKPIFDTPPISFTPPLVIKLRDRVAEQSGRCAADKLRSALSVLFAWGRERGLMADNPADKIKALKRAKDAPQPNRPWADAEREIVLAALPAHILLPFTLMMYCGLDPIDVVSLPRTAIKDGLIDTKRSKTNQPVWIPLPHPVKEAMGSAPQHTAITVCANSRGRPWTVQGFSFSWQVIKQRLLAEGAIGEGLTLKGLRHTVATILAEMGYDDRTIADMLSQRTPLPWRSTIPIAPIARASSPQW